MGLIVGTAVVVVSILTILFAYFKYKFEYFKSRGIPFEAPLFPYGNIKGIGRKFHRAEYVQKIYNKFKPTGAKLCGFFAFSRPVVVLLDLELMKNVLVRDFSNFESRGVYHNEEDDPLSANLFSLDGEKWKKLRYKLTPTFTSGKMKFMFPVLVEIGDRFRDCLLEVIQEHSDVLEIKDLCARYTTDIIGTCAFGIECNSLKDPNAEFRRYGRRVFGAQSLLITLLLNGFPKLSRKLHIKVIEEDVTKFFVNAVADTVEYREKNNVIRNDFMDILIKLKNQETTDTGKMVSLNEFAALAFVFYLAGFETSSTTLTYALYELANHPEVQSKARQEIRDRLEKHNGKLTYEMMMEIPYVDQVLQETLRKYPSLGILNRMAKNDYLVPGTKTVIEKGTPVFIPALAIHYDPAIYPDPEKFDPDRFSDEKKQTRDAMTWLAFGDGPRNCIGLRFGMMQSRIGLITLLNNFEFSVCEKTEVPQICKQSFITQPKGGVYLKVRPCK